MLPRTDFPVNLNRGEDQIAIFRADENLELDFFADKNKSNNNNNNNNTDFMAGLVVKKEISSSQNIDAPTLHAGLDTGLNLVIANSGSYQSTVDDGISADAADNRAKNELAQSHVELERMNGENQRLKEILSQVTSNYTALHGHLVTLMQQQANSRTENKQELQEKGVMVPKQFLELVPNAKAEKDKPSQSSSGERTIYASPHQSNKEVSISKNGNPREGEGVGREESPDSESWVPNKVPKFNAFETVDQAAAEATMRKARVSVHARSEAPMITDGCQWRKYGQKMVKGNPCPRGYYRCTMAVGCPVRKHVQRCAEDQTILITSYEGTHNHPLPPAAMPVASTTSAAATMLLSGSMSSADGLMNPNFLARAILPCYNSSMATISASLPFPTVTLDFTHSPNPLQFQRPPNPFQVPFSGHPHQNFAAMPNPPSMAQVLGQTLYNQSKFSGLQVSQEMESTTAQVPFQSPQSQQGQNVQTSFADTLSAATAAITADPNFMAALAAAITSIINGGQGNPNNSNAANTNATNVARSNSCFTGTR